MAYQVDLRDLKFQLFEWLPAEKLLAAERFADWDKENVEMVLDEALKVAREVFAPTNDDGDRIGITLKDGRVTTPDSFKGAYQTLRDGGWVGITMNPEYGGLGLPELVGTAADQILTGANMAFALTTLLTRGCVTWSRTSAATSSRRRSARRCTPASGPAPCA